MIVCFSPKRTFQAQLPAAHFVADRGECQLSNSIASAGCVINSSSMKNTILFSNVKIGANCKLENAVIMPGCDIGANCRLSNVFVDNSCLVCNATVIGEDLERDRRNFDITENSVVVINREMMGQGVQYMPGIKPEDMQSA